MDRPATAPDNERKQGRGMLWAGVGMCILGIVACGAQFAMGRLFVPWYLPVSGTLGAVLCVVALARRRNLTRVVVLALVAALAGLEWYFIGVMARLPEYQGPAQAGAAMPTFTTARADGRPFTQDDFRDARANILVFFRGRW